MKPNTAHSMKELLLRDFGVDLPISGGNGNSIENAVQILEMDSYSLASIELTYLQCLGQGRRIKWTLIGHELLRESHGVFEKLKIETVEETASEIITQIENYYFDITTCQHEQLPLPASIYNLSIPTVISGYLLKFVENNEFNQAGLGYSLYYGSPGWKATVYIYSHNLNDDDPPTSPRESIVKDHFKQIIEDVGRSVESGLRQEMKIKDVYGTILPDTNVEFLCAELLISEEDELLDSFVFLTVHDGRYFKIRMTTDHYENSVAEAFEFVSAWSVLLEKI
jgi:hypothetical protein